jgi:hypothetical protein
MVFIINIDMPALENWGDLFKYGKELLDDDYNAGQALVVKTKTKSEDNVSVHFILSYFLGVEQHLQVGSVGRRLGVQNHI